MMDESDVRARIKSVIVERLMLEGLEPASIQDDDPLFGEGLGLDSVDALELVLGLEQEFGVRVNNDELGRESFASVAALAELVQRLAAAPSGETSA